MATPFTTYKLIILYMLKHTKNPLTNVQISDFILEKEYTNYFHLQQAISELVDTDLILRKAVDTSSHYSITEEGRMTLSYFEKELSEDIRYEVIEYLLKIGSKQPEKIMTPADYYKTPQNRFAVRCQVIENGTTILDLTMAAPNEEAAKEISRNWAKKYQTIYETIMEELL